jgi:hypothetical protein
MAMQLVRFTLTMTIRILAVLCPIHPRWGRKQCYYIAIQPYHPTGSADRHRAVCVDRLVQRSLTARSNLGEFRDDPVVNAGQRPAYPGGPGACVPGWARGPRTRVGQRPVYPGGPEARVLGPEQSRGVSQ